MAFISSNIKEQYAPLEEVTIPSCFRIGRPGFPRSKTSENVRHNHPLKSRKRGSSAVSEESTTSDGSDSDYHVEYRRTVQRLKCVKVNDDDGKTRRQTRSMMSKS